MLREISIREWHTNPPPAHKIVGESSWDGWMLYVHPYGGIDTVWFWYHRLKLKLSRQVRFAWATFLAESLLKLDYLGLKQITDEHRNSYLKLSDLLADKEDK